MPDPHTLTNTVPTAQMKADLQESGFTRGSGNDPNSNDLGLATVTFVDYGRWEITIRMETGEVFQHNVALTFPGAGNRHFFGSLPMVGDVCVVGWGAAESGRNKKPYILSWVVGGVVPGLDWWVTQPFARDEYNLNPKNQKLVEGIANRIRHKLRHMEPGNIVCSSAQGADMVLDEGVLLANRRGNEIRLRDQDQSFIVRSLQQFHAMAGARVYAGMVQRDATLLPTMMRSDGRYWDGPEQLDSEGVPISVSNLGASPYTSGALTPAPVFQRDSDGNPLVTMDFPSNVDPYEFLQQGLFVDSNGKVAADTVPDAVYGGKALYRVSTGNTNAVLDADSETLTEYRIEVAHTSDGTLPVTEQTDGFDADRLPPTTPRDNNSLSGSPNSPFIEMVMGSVVGNDPFSVSGRKQYGKPLYPYIFDGEVRSPGLSSGVGVPVGQHAASLFRMCPPLDTSAAPVFWSVTKDGRVMASIPGNSSTWAVEAALGSGMHLGSGMNQDGKSILVDTDGGIRLHSNRGDNQTNYGVELVSDEGAIRIFGGGQTSVGGVAARSAPSGDGEAGLPSVSIESNTNIEIRAGRKLTLIAQQLDLTQANALNINLQSVFEVRAGEKISTQTKVQDTVVMGQATETFSGPKDSLPTNTPLRKTQFTANPATGLVGGTVDEYTLLYGDRDETLSMGNHQTQVLVGNQTYSCGVGTWRASAGLNNMEIGVGSVAINTAAGPMSFSATAGAASITSSTSATIAATSIALTAATVSLPGAHLPAGAVLTDGCINPLTGTPFSVSGVIGVQTFRVGA